MYKRQNHRTNRRPLTLTQKRTGMGPGNRRDLVGRAHAHDAATGCAAIRAHVDDPVRRADHVEVVLDYQ